MKLKRVAGAFGALAVMTLSTSACNVFNQSVPAYVASGDPWLADMADETTNGDVPDLVVLNASPEGIDDLDDEADALRADGVVVLGYVDYGLGLRNSLDVQADIDLWTPVSLDGFFWDQVPRQCANGGDPDGHITATNYFTQYAYYERGNQADMVHAANMGTAVEECWLDGSAGDDSYIYTFVTFEGTEDTYDQIAGPGNSYVGYTGGNYYIDGVGYYPGTEYNRWKFWHLVYDMAGTDMEATADLAFDRHAGHFYGTDDGEAMDLNPWNEEPPFFWDENAYLHTFT